MSEHIRKCAGCAGKFGRAGMIRVQKNSVSGEILINPDNYTFGRSVYICKNKKCVEAAFKKGRIFKLLKTQPQNQLKEKLLGLFAGKE